MMENVTSSSLSSSFDVRTITNTPEGVRLMPGEWKATVTADFDHGVIVSGWETVRAQGAPCCIVAMSWALFEERLAKPLEEAKYPDNPKDGSWMSASLMPEKRGKQHVLGFGNIVILDCETVKDVPPPPEEMFARAKSLFPGVNLALYTTFSHELEPSVPKYRIVVEFSRCMTFEEWRAVTQYVIEKLGAEPFTDPCSREQARAMYLPHKSSSSAPYFWGIVKDGKPLDVDSVLSAIPGEEGGQKPTDCVPRDQKGGVAADDSKSPAAPGKDSHPPVHPVVDAFCKAYTIQDVMELFLLDVYEPDGSKYRLRSSSSHAGVLVSHNGRVATSFHTTDPAVGPHNAFDFVRIHKFGTGEDSRGKMLAWAKKLPEVAALLSPAKTEKKPQKASKEPSSGDGTAEGLFWTLRANPRSGGTTVRCHVTRALEYLEENGLYRYFPDPSDPSCYEFVRIQDGVIDAASCVSIRDFLMRALTEDGADDQVREYFLSHMDKDMRDRQLERLGVLKADLFDFRPDVQRLNFRNGAVEITADGIRPLLPLHNVWRKQLVGRDFTRVSLLTAARKDGAYLIEFTPEGEKCEFLTFLRRASITAFTHDHPVEMSPGQERDHAQHLVNKLTALGYLLCPYKFPSETVAVVAEDLGNTESGRSNGGTGKSLYAGSLRHVTSLLTMDGKNKDDDRFAYQLVDAQTRVILIDDLYRRYDFDRLYTPITGPMTVERKYAKPLHIPASRSPKFILTTNHGIDSAGGTSTRRRIAPVGFSQWYNKDHTPFDEFGHHLFDDWEQTQWTLFDNLMAECVRLYLLSRREGWPGSGRGIVPPPSGDSRRRALRLEIPDDLLEWADGYFAPEAGRLNVPNLRSDVTAAYLGYADLPAGSCSPVRFKNSLRDYCRYRGLDFNPTRPGADNAAYTDWVKSHPREAFIGGDDKRAGNEYFTLARRDDPSVSAPPPAFGDYVPPRPASPDEEAPF